MQSKDKTTLNIYVDEGSFSSPFYNFYLDPAGREPFNGFELDPSQTYTFRRLNEVTSHPFYISTSATDPAFFSLSGDGSSTQGITGDQTLTLRFADQADAGGLLNYYCTAHPSMQGTFEATSLGTNDLFLVSDIRSGANSSNPEDLTAYRKSLVFSAEDAYGNREVWTTRGTEQSTTKLKEINAEKGSNPKHFTTLGNKLFFVANDGVHGRELWTSKGRESSTALVSDIHSGKKSSLPRDLTTFKKRLFFTADDGNGRRIYSTNGRSAKTYLSDLTLHSDSELTVFRNKLFFVAESATDGRALYKWNGRSATATKIYDSYPDDTRNHSTIDQLTVAGNKLYFTASTYAANTELYVTKGSGRFPRIVRDINTRSGGSNPTNLTSVGSTLYFSADNGKDGRNLWSTQGKSKNTKQVADIYEGGTANVDLITNVEGTLFFAASSLNEAGNPIYRELWKHDPLTGETALVKDIHPTSASLQYNNTLVDAHGKLLFTANDGSNGLELWSSDGSESGTNLINDLYPGRTGSSPSAVTVIGEYGFFSAQADQNGRELYAISLNAL